MTKEELMRKAIELSKENVENGGGPFGAVIATKDRSKSCHRFLRSYRSCRSKRHTRCRCKAWYIQS